MRRKCIKVKEIYKPLIHFYKVRQTNFMLRSRILHLKKQVFLPVTTNRFMLAIIKFDKLYDNNRIVMRVTCETVSEVSPSLTASNFVNNTGRLLHYKLKSVATENTLED